MAHGDYKAVPIFITDEEDTRPDLKRFCSRRSSLGGKQGCRDRHERRQERLNSELLIAILQSNVTQVNSLLEDGANPDARCRERMCSTVHVAALRGDIEILERLLEAGASNYSRDADGRQAIHLASWAGNESIIQQLLEVNPDLLNAPVQRFPEDWKPEQLDSWNHNHNDITKLLPKITLGSTPLHVACMSSQVSTVQYLLSKNADVQLKDSQGVTPLDVAGVFSKPRNVSKLSSKLPSFENLSAPSAYSGRRKNSLFSIPEIQLDGVDLPEFPNEERPLKSIVKALVEKGAIPTNDTKTFVTALHTAVLNEDLESIDLLLEIGANLIVLNEDGESPMHLAVRLKLLEPLKYILSWLELDKIDIKSSLGLTSLHQAVIDEWESGVGILLESGADVKLTTDSKNETVLHIASRLGNPKLLEELLTMEDSSQIINSRDVDGYTPLFRAIEKSSLPAVEMLITYEADLGITLPGLINVLHSASNIESSLILKLLLDQETENLLDRLNTDGFSPLHLASKNGRFEHVQFLIEKGSTVGLRTNGDSTALHFASQNGYSKTVSVILTYDVECLKLKDDNGWTPLHIAAGYGHGKSAIIMLEKGASIADTVPYHGVRRSALDLMILNIPKCIDRLEDLFDDYIKTDGSIKYVSCEIKLKFEILLGPTKADPTEDKQLVFLNTLLNNGNPLLKEKLMLHPLIESFLFYKWINMKLFFNLLLLFYFIHTILLTYLSIKAFVFKEDITSFWIIFASCIMIPIIFTEILQALPFKRYYFVDNESWIKWALIASSIVTVSMDPKANFSVVKHFACFSVLLSWTELLFLLARYPVWGLHVLMFEKVAENIFQVLTRFAFLFAGFLFAFMIHFEGEAPFGNLWEAMCKIMIMIVELDYSDQFNETELNSSSIIGRMMYVAFLLLVATAMTNLIVGMAVSDVAALENQGRTQRLVKQTAFLSFLELCLYNDFLLECFPYRLKEFIRNFRSVPVEMIVHPNKSTEVLPAHLRSNLLAKALAKERQIDNDEDQFETLNQQLKQLENKMNLLNDKIECILSQKNNII